MSADTATVRMTAQQVAMELPEGTPVADGIDAVAMLVGAELTEEQVRVAEASLIGSGVCERPSLAPTPRCASSGLPPTECSRCQPLLGLRDALALRAPNGYEVTLETQMGGGCHGIGVYPATPGGPHVLANDECGSVYVDPDDDEGCNHVFFDDYPGATDGELADRLMDELMEVLP